VKLGSLSSVEFKNDLRHASIPPDTTLQNMSHTLFAEMKLNGKNMEFLNSLCLIDLCRKETGLVSFAGKISYWLCPSYKRVRGSVECLAPFCDATDLPAHSIAVYHLVTYCLLSVLPTLLS